MTIRLEAAECFPVTANNLGSSYAAMRRAAFGSAFPRTLARLLFYTEKIVVSLPSTHSGANLVCASPIPVLDGKRCTTKSNLTGLPCTNVCCTLDGLGGGE